MFSRRVNRYVLYGFQRGVNIILDNGVEEAKKIQLLKSIIGQEPGVAKFSDEDGNTLLHYAAKAGDYPDLLYYLIFGARVNVNKKNNREITPFIIAVTRGNIKQVKVFLKSKVRKNVTFAEGTNILHFAYGYPEILKALLPQYYKKLNQKDVYGRTPLHIILSDNTNSEVLVQLLPAMLRVGANINANTNEGESILKYAVLEFPNVINNENINDYGIPRYVPVADRRQLKFPIGENNIIIEALLKLGADPFSVRYGLNEIVDKYQLKRLPLTF